MGCKASRVLAAHLGTILVWSSAFRRLRLTPVIGRLKAELRTFAASGLRTVLRYARALAGLLICLLCLTGRAQAPAQTTGSEVAPRPERVLLIFSEASDLPGNAMMEQALRAEIQAHSTNEVEFFTENLDASRFPSAAYFREFEDYLRDKYSGQHLDLVMAFVGRDFTVAGEIPATMVSSLPVVFVVVGDMNVPNTFGARPFVGIVQRFDVPGTIHFIFQLQPEVRRVVVIGGASESDQITLARIRKAAGLVDGVKFDFWTNRPMAEIREAVGSLPMDTVVLLATVQRGMDGQVLRTPQLAQLLAPSASVPVYVLAASSIGSGAVGGDVIDFERLGADAGDLALGVLGGEAGGRLPVELRSNGVPMVDWRALQKWNIKPGRLPAHCVIEYRPRSLWEGHQALILFAGACLLAQAVTIAVLLVQQRRQRRAEAEILRQRAELAHITRVSAMGQLTSALTHELNQPLGAILRNAEAAEIFLQRDPPNLQEVRAILADIRRDDKRAGSVIDGMRSLYQRRSVVAGSLDLRELVEKTVAITRPDAEARQIKLSVQMPAHLPPARGDRVHLQQVLLILILNGMDAMNGVPKAKRTLIIRAEETGHGNLKVAVTDHGTGIPPENAARIFEPFFTTKPTGMGMGLAVTQTIIEAHGGDLWVESNAMEGTTFTFILPPAGLEKVKDGDLPVPP